MPIVKIRNNGTLTLPAKFRKKYKIQKGQAFVISEAGKDSFFLDKPQEEKNNPAVKIRGDGALTLPAQFRQKHKIEKGQAFTIIDIDDGSFLFSFGISKMDEITTRAAKIMKEDGVTLEDMFQALRVERKKLVKEIYGNVKIPSNEKN